MAETFKPLAVETSCNTTASTYGNGKLVRLLHTGATTVANLITSTSVITFNSNTDVDSTNDFISFDNVSGTTSSLTYLRNGDAVLYTTNTSNTALTGLSNNTSYYVVGSNTTGCQLASSAGGANLNITKSLTESGHNLTRTNWTITVIGTKPIVVSKNPRDFLSGTDTGTAVKAVPIAFTN